MPLFHLSNIRVPLVHAFPPGTRGVFAHCPVVWIMSRCIKWKGLDSFISTGSCLLERMCISTPHFTDADYVQDAVLDEGHWETGCCHGGRLIAKHVPSIHSLLVRGAILLPLVFLRAIHESLKEKKAKWSTFRSSGAWVRLVELKCSITDHGGWRGFISQRLCSRYLACLACMGAAFHLCTGIRYWVSSLPQTVTLTENRKSQPVQVLRPSKPLGSSTHRRCGLINA